MTKYILNVYLNKDRIVGSDDNISSTCIFCGLNLGFNRLASLTASARITRWRLQVFTATAWDTYSGARSRAGTWSAVFVGVWFVLGAGVLYVQLRWDCCENKHC